MVAVCLGVYCQVVASISVAVGGTLEGVVSVIAAPSRRLTSPGAYPGRSVSVGTPSGGSELANVIVFVDLAASTPAPSTRVAIRQVDEVFVPHVVAITTGSTVDFPNDDLIFHNVFSLSRPASFDFGRYPRGASKGRVFDKPGIVKVFCHFHSHMSALVRVFGHPYFARPDAAGHFVIDGIPAGKHRVVAWHERVGEVSHQVVVIDGGRVSLSFELPVTDTP